ncbi:hypothetical protein LI221_09915 [Faecalimonas umbilicata]|nr:hypothetical protein [Faecalimonas umbilicata]
MGEIEFDFGIAGQAQDRIRDAAVQMNTEVLPGMEEALQGITEAWRTEAGEQFRELAEEEFHQMQRLAKLLQETDDSLKEAIVTAKQAEERAKEVARLRTY